MIGVGEVKLSTLSETSRGVKLFDGHDNFLCTIHADRDRQPVALSKVSINMRNAILAAEDRNFYRHSGLDLTGIARALWRNYAAGHIVEGGSTITQQLVRSLYLDKTDQSFKRKLKEAFLAWDIDHSYSKEKILETYLNEVYFGSGAYGVDRAAQRYFSKHADSLTISESAFLAGLIKSPSVLGTPANRKAALVRQRLVIGKMADFGFIARDLSQKAQSSTLVFKSNWQTVPYPYYIRYAMQVLQRSLGNDLWTHDWRIYTHLDVQTQQIAESTLNKGIESAPRGIDQGALVTMSVRDGAVLAMVGGVGPYDNSPWNRALFPHTAGSSFKPFVYLAGLIDGVIQPDTLIYDAPLVDKSGDAQKYDPRNFDGRFLGWITARSALAWSRNVCSVRVAQEATIDRVIEVAHLAGIKAQLNPNPSLALGSCAVSPLDMTTAYATLARGGVYLEPQLLRRIECEDDSAKRTFQATPDTRLPNEAVAQLVDVMQDVVRCGTGTEARLLAHSVAGKTGTADNGKDLWFVGFTPDTVTAVWGGNDRNRSVRGIRVTGGAVMARIWHDYMTSFYSIRKVPVRLAFASPIRKLVTTVPQSSDARLLAGTIANADPNAKITDAQLNGANLREECNMFSSTPAEDFNNLQMLIARGIARASDLQRGQAKQRWQEQLLTQSQETMKNEDQKSTTESSTSVDPDYNSYETSKAAAE
jgi:1A family penicillin-binding protein